MILVVIIAEFIGSIRFFVSYCFVLHPVKLIVLYIGGDALIFQPLIVLFRTITGICCNGIGLLLKVVYMLADMTINVLVSVVL